MLLELFVVGGLLFWLLFAAELTFVVGCLHFRRGLWATISLGVFLLALWLLGDFNAFLWVWRNPATFAWGAGAYIAIAAIWGFAKWAMYQRENSYRYLELRSQFLKESGVEGTDLPAHLKVQWQEWFNQHNRPSDWEGSVEFNPLTSQHKATIMGWMIFWPISVVWTLIDDAVIKLFRHIYYMMYNWQESIRRYYWGNYERDMPTQEETQAHWDKARQVAQEARLRQDPVS